MLETVPTIGADWCPPGMLGIGNRRHRREAMLTAKQSLMGDIDMQLLFHRKQGA